MTFESPMERFGAVVDLGNYQKEQRGWVQLPRNIRKSSGSALEIPCAPMASLQRPSEECAEEGTEVYPGQKDLVDRLGKEAKTQRHNVASR
jgi:hypothetical protein